MKQLADTRPEIVHLTSRPLNLNLSAVLRLSPFIIYIVSLLKGVVYPTRISLFWVSPIFTFSTIIVGGCMTNISQLVWVWYLLCFYRNQILICMHCFGYHIDASCGPFLSQMALSCLWCPLIREGNGFPWGLQPTSSVLTAKRTQTWYGEETMVWSTCIKCVISYTVLFWCHED